MHPLQINHFRFVFQQLLKDILLDLKSHVSRAFTYVLGLLETHCERILNTLHFIFCFVVVLKVDNVLVLDVLDPVAPL